MRDRVSAGRCESMPVAAHPPTAMVLRLLPPTTPPIASPIGCATDLVSRLRLVRRPNVRRVRSWGLRTFGPPILSAGKDPGRTRPARLTYSARPRPFCCPYTVISSRMRINITPRNVAVEPLVGIGRHAHRHHHGTHTQQDHEEEARCAPCAGPGIYFWFRLRLWS